MRRILWTVLLALVVGAAPACSTHTKHVAVVADSTLSETLNAVHAGEQVALCGMPSCQDVANPPTVPGWTLAKSQAFNQKLLPAISAGMQFNTILGQWTPGTPLPDQARALITSLGESLSTLMADFPESPAKAAIVANIGKAQAIVLNTLNFVLTVKGS